MDTFELGSVHPSALVSEGAELGENVTVGPFSVLHSGATVGSNTVVGSHCIIGEPTSDFYGGLAPVAETVIGPNSIVRSHSVIYQGALIGAGLSTGHHVTIREGTMIGEHVQIGTKSDLQGLLSVGNFARLHSNVFVAQYSVIEDFAWLFPDVVLANDPHPPSDSCTRGPVIRRFAVLGARSTVLPGIEVGEHSLVGASSLVTRDVAAETLVAGVPAKPRGSVRDVECRHGNLDVIYPWPLQFRRGYPDGALPASEELLECRE